MRGARTAALIGGLAAIAGIGYGGLALFPGASTDYGQLGNLVTKVPLGGLEVASPIQLSETPVIVLERGTIKAEPAQIAKALAAQVAGGSFVLSRVSLEDAVVVVNVSAGGRASGERPDYGQSPLLGALASMGVDALHVKGATVRLRAADGSSEELTGVNATAQARGRNSFAVKGTLAWRGAPIEIDGSVGLVAPQVAGRFAVKAGIKSQLLEASFDGRLEATRGLQLRGEAESSFADARETARWLGLELPAGAGLRDLKVNGKFSWADRVIAFEQARFAMDGSEATGTLSLEAAQSPPQIEGTLAFKSLDLARHLTRPAAGGTAAAQRSPLEWDVGLPLIRHIDADLRLSADRLAIPGLELGGAAVTLSVKRSRLLADVAEMELDGGRANGQVTVDMSGDMPRYSIRAKAESLDATKALAALLMPGWLQGKATVSADISGVGMTVLELLNDFSGRMSLAVPHGGRLGVDMRALLAPARPSGTGAVVSAFKGSTSFSHAELKAYLRQGDALIGSGRLGLGPDLDVRLSGQAMILDRHVEVVLTPEDPAAIRAKMPDVSPRGRNLRSVRLAGPWSTPQISEMPGRTN